MIRIAVVAVLAVLAIAFAPMPESIDASAPRHPHFQKKLEARVSRDVTITVTYQTVTFDKAGAKKMKPGKSWHLAGATIETTSDVDIGGQKVAAGTYALSVMKAKGGKWNLTLHKGRGFSRPGQDAKVLKTRFMNNAPLFEHMNIDVQPAGDKEHTTLHLDVRFDKLLASATITVPKKEK